jgi:hypothetical protein
VEVTGEPDKIESLISVLSPFGILEIMRTGKIAMTRGVVEPVSATSITNGRNGRQRVTDSQPELEN